jgi:hypothetical protein
VFDPAIIRRICQQLAAENDRQKTRELLSLLESVVRDDQEEVRLRLKYLAKHYKTLLEDEAPDVLLKNDAA